jgi:hypothetical protein
MTAYVASLVLLAGAIACFVLGYAADGLMLVWTSIGLSAASAATWIVFITRRAPRA